MYENERSTFKKHEDPETQAEHPRVTFHLGSFENI
jgi:hypothetical protein